MTRRARALTVECPTCGQGPGSPCKDLRGLYTPGGYVRSIRGVHTARVTRGDQTERLRRLESDPNLMHTSARWRAHDAVYPNSGACEMVARCLPADAYTLKRFEAGLTEAREKLAADDPAITYYAWLVDELSASLHPTPRSQT